MRILEGKRDVVKENLAAREIGTMVYYPVYNASEMLAGEVLSLPIWAELDESTVKFVAAKRVMPLSKRR